MCPSPTPQKGPSGNEKTRVLSGLTHELRTPLGSILMMSELLAENPAGRLDDREIRYAQNIHRAVSDLLELVDQVGELARIEAGRMKVTATAVKLADLRARLEERYAARAEELGLTLAVEVAPDGAPSVTTDREKAERILDLLIESALKVGERGGGVRIELAGAEDGRFEAVVGDSGAPPTDDEQQVLFEPFAAAGPRSSRRFGGSGLGLPLAHALAVLLKGELSAECSPGGCRFRLHLPGAP